MARAGLLFYSGNRQALIFPGRRTHSNLGPAAPPGWWQLKGLRVRARREVEGLRARREVDVERLVVPCLWLKSNRSVCKGRGLPSAWSGPRMYLAALFCPVLRACGRRTPWASQLIRARKKYTLHIILSKQVGQIILSKQVESFRPGLFSARLSLSRCNPPAAHSSLRRAPQPTRRGRRRRTGAPAPTPPTPAAPRSSSRRRAGCGPASAAPALRRRRRSS